MGNKLTFDGDVNALFDGLPPEAFPGGSSSVIVNGEKFIRTKQTFGQSREPLIKGECTTLGWFIAKCVGNYPIYFCHGPIGDDFMKLIPSEPPQRIRLATNDPQGIAIGGNSDLIFLLSEH